jgi:hypothetical protein
MGRIPGAIFAAIVLGPALAAAASFDGTWSVVEVCDASKEGGRGYTWRYDVTIANGHLVGHRGTIRGSEQSQFTLEGDVRPDGTATLTGQGVSENSDYNVHFAQKGARIYYKVAAKFAATQGTGDRLGERRCKFTFAKQTR